MPNFLVIGAPKCGTTSLCLLLAEHPDVFMCDPKEPRFFSHDEFYGRGLGWYQSLFAQVKAQKAVGEGSTSYSVATRDRISAQRICRHIPHAKLIYCVRHPLRRIESIWMEHHFGQYGSGPNFSEGTVSADFNQDVLANCGFIDTSRYYSRLNVFREYFDDKQIHVVFLEDRIAEPARTIATLFSFLGVTPDPEIARAQRRANVSKERRLPNPLGILLRKVPGNAILLSLMPSSVKRILSPFLTWKFRRRPVWLPHVYAHAVEQIQEDACSLLRHCNKPSEFWTFYEPLGKAPTRELMEHKGLSE